MTDESDTVYLLLGSVAYYPQHDNTICVLADKDRADEIRKRLDDISRHDSKRQYRKLAEEFDCLPERHLLCERYSVESYEVHGDEL